MDNFLQQIIDADKQAAKRAAQAVEAREAKEKEARQNFEKDRAWQISKAKKELAAQKTDLSRRLTQKRESAANDLSAKMQKLNRVFDRNKNAWKEDIVKRITGV